MRLSRDGPSVLLLAVEHGGAEGWLASGGWEINPRLRSPVSSGVPNGPCVRRDSNARLERTTRTHDSNARLERTCLDRACVECSKSSALPAKADTERYHRLFDATRGRYSGPVYSKACEPGRLNLMGSNTWEGTYFVFIDLGQ